MGAQTMADVNRETVLNLARQAEAASASAVRHAMEKHRGKLPPSVRKQLARNVGRLLLRAKLAKVPMREIAKASGIKVDQDKPENSLAYYRLYEDGKRTAKEPILRGDIKGYLGIALAVASRLGVPETEAVLELAQDVGFFSWKAADTTMEPAEQVCALLRLRLREIQLERALDDYFRQVHALRALPVNGDGGQIDGWECDLYGQFEPRETNTWPSVLLMAVQRAAAPGKMRVDDREMPCEVAWVEKVYLTLGPDSGGIVRPYLEFRSYMALSPSGPDAWKYCMEAPWLQYGYPPPSGTWWFGERIVFGILPGKKVDIPPEYEDEEARAAAANNPFDCFRLERLDAKTLTTWFIDRKEMMIDGQFLPRVVDAVGLLSPPDSALSLLEGALLGRETGGLSDERDFLAELDRKAGVLVNSFNEWRARAAEDTLEAHRRLLDESERRVAKLSTRPSSEVGR